jgi:hypothetical protein
MKRRGASQPPPPRTWPPARAPHRLAARPRHPTGPGGLVFLARIKQTQHNPLLLLPATQMGFGMAPPPSKKVAAAPELPLPTPTTTRGTRLPALKFSHGPRHSRHGHGQTTRGAEGSETHHLVTPLHHHLLSSLPSAAAVRVRFICSPLLSPLDCSARLFCVFCCTTNHGRTEDESERDQGRAPRPVVEGRQIGHIQRQRRSTG